MQCHLLPFSPPSPAHLLTLPCPHASDLPPASCRVTEDKLSNEVALICSTSNLPYCAQVTEDKLSKEVVSVDLNRPMAEILAQLSQYPIRTRLSLTGTLVVARDIAHAKLKERMDAGQVRGGEVAGGHAGGCAGHCLRQPEGEDGCRPVVESVEGRNRGFVEGGNSGVGKGE